MSEPAPRQTLQQRVAAAILDGAAQIFAVQGEQASMNDVAEAAGVARATVYRYFPNRESPARRAGAGRGGRRRRTAGVGQDRRGGAGGGHRPGRACARRGGDSFVLLARERLRSDPEHFERRLTEPLRRLFERGQAAGDIRDDITSARLTESLIGLIVGVLTSTPSLGREDMTATITGLFLDGARARGPRPPMRPTAEPKEEQMEREPDPQDTPTSRSRSTTTAGATDAAGARRSDRRADALLQELVAYLRENRTELREEWARRISDARAAGRHVGRGDLLRGDRGLRQLRGRAGDRQHREPPDVRPRALGADHPPRRRDPRGARDRPAPARRAGALAVRQVPGRPGPAQPHPRLLRAGGEPHRGDRRGELRRGARARHPRAAGGHARAVHARSCSSATAC